MTPHYPMNWKTSLLDDVCVRGSGHTPSKKHPEYWDGGIKWVSLADCDSLDRVFIADTKKNISELGLQNSSARMHAKGTVVLSRDAGVGKSAILADEMAVSQHFIAWECLSKGIIDHKFLYQWLQHNKRRFEIAACGSTIPTIGVPYFSCLEISYPPIEQQRAISELLTELDCICLATEQLIRVKQRRRQALAQRLLLREAHVAHWPAAPLGDYFARVRRKNAVSCQRVLTASGRQGLVDQEKYFNKCVAGKNLSNYTRLVRGEFAYNRSAMTGYPCGAVKRLSDFDEGVVSPLYICLGLDHSRGDSDFFCHYFESGILDRELSRIVQVGARSHGMLNISATDLLALDVRVPSLPRQREIAAILNDADREIALHRAELDALKRQKRGLMQQLLTGKVRVP